MPKQKKSKLDQYAVTLLEMDDAKKTLPEILAWLKEEGVSVAPSTLSVYLESARRSRLQKKLLAQITSGARQCREVEAEFAKNPAPELETLIKLQRVILLNLSTQANADPGLLELIGNSFKAVMDSEKLKLKREELSLAKDKFQFDAVTACRKHLPALKAIESNKALSESEKTQMFMEKLFGTKPQ